MCNNEVSENDESCTHRHCNQARARGVNTVSHKFMTSDEIGQDKIVNRVPLPGDEDYNGVCTCSDGKYA